VSVSTVPVADCARPAGPLDERDPLDERLGPSIVGRGCGIEAEGNARQEPWMKSLDRDDRPRSVDWHRCFRRMREALGVEGTHGYVLHEAGNVLEEDASLGAYKCEGVEVV
jgi:hypothetical protein